MSNEVDVAIHFLECILGNKGEPTINAIADLYEIHNGNKKVILEHLQAIYNIIGHAIQEIEK